MSFETLPGKICCFDSKPFAPALWKFMGGRAIKFRYESAWQSGNWNGSVKNKTKLHRMATFWTRTSVNFAGIGSEMRCRDECQILGKGCPTVARKRDRWRALTQFYASEERLEALAFTQSRKLNSNTR